MSKILLNYESEKVRKTYLIVANGAPPLAVAGGSLIKYGSPFLGI